jgi:DNA modification methylase
VSTPQDRAQAYLARIGRAISRDLVAGDALIIQIVELDIRKCRLLADAGLRWARERPRIQAACVVLSIDEDEWCRRVLGRSIVTLQGYRQVGREWGRYVRERRALGDCGATGIDLAKSLVPMNRPATNSRNSRDCAVGGLDMSKVTFVTSDALGALKKMGDQSATVLATSPPYWPIRRLYAGSFGGLAVGWERTPQEYIERLIAIFREGKRVLHRRGTLIVVMRDAYSPARGARYQMHTHRRKRPGPQKEWLKDGTPIQFGDRPTGNLLLLPQRFAMAMQDEGWILRMMLPVKIKGRPESVEDRTTHDIEWVLVFAKQRRYYWNQDVIREPLAEGSRPMRRGKTKDGVLRRDRFRDLLVVPNWLGRNSSSMPAFNASNYRGKHPATLPLDMAEWLLSAACDDNAHVVDPFGGVGTFALAALRLGHRATSVEIFEEYTKEAIERLSHAPATRPGAADQGLSAANDNVPRGTLVGD